MSQQQNIHACGVYICRYAYNMYLMRNHVFTTFDIDTNFKFITDSAEFKFTGYDINRIREQLNVLVQTMSFLYKKRKQFDILKS